MASRVTPAGAAARSWALTGKETGEEHQALDSIAWQMLEGAQNVRRWLWTMILVALAQRSDCPWVLIYQAGRVVPISGKELHPGRLHIEPPRAGKAPGAGTRACAPMHPKSPAVSPDLHRPGLDPTPPKPPACTYWMIGGSPAAPPAGSPWPKDAAKTGSSERPPDASARSATWTPSDAPVAQRPQRRRQRHPRRGLGLPVLCRPGPGRGRPGRAAVVVAVAP